MQGSGQRAGNMWFYQRSWCDAALLRAFPLVQGTPCAATCPMRQGAACLSMACQQPQPATTYTCTQLAAAFWNLYRRIRTNNRPTLPPTRPPAARRQRRARRPPPQRCRRGACEESPPRLAGERNPRGWHAASRSVPAQRQNRRHDNAGSCLLCENRLFMSAGEVKTLRTARARQVAHERSPDSTRLRRTAQLTSCSNCPSACRSARSVRLSAGLPRGSSLPCMSAQ